MLISFNIHYVTQWGSHIRLLLQEINELGESHILSHMMLFSNDFLWKIELGVADGNSEINYKYEHVSESGQVMQESGEFRRLILPANEERIHVIDSWRNSFGEAPFVTSAFQDCYFKRSSSVSTTNSKGNFCLQLFAPQMEPDRHFAVVGNQEFLGNWDVSQKVRLNDDHFPLWRIQFDVDDIQLPLEYKYLIVDSITDEVLAWEGGANRKIESLDAQSYQIFSDENFIRTIPSWKGAGVAIPVFSLRSMQGYGVGDFQDLKLLVDWAQVTGQKIIQILPINDTILHHTNQDSYPYNAVSVYALHPIYLNLDALGKIKHRGLRATYAKERERLNSKSFVDYLEVMMLKWDYCQAMCDQTAQKIFKSADFKKFFDKNSAWLIPYAVFSYLRDLNDTPDFTKWEFLNTYNQEEVTAFASPEHESHDDIAFYYFVQYHLDKQLTEVHDYARSRGIVIKGDIPIGVSPHSVDAWVDTELFNTSMQAGAPPDDFSVTGQNWGFPTYNWELMEKDRYQWWRKRLQKLAEYFDAYRIDHILGFFRIWEIPQKDVWGLTGCFHPALPFSVSELQRKGLVWDEARFLKPYLKEHLLQEVFGTDVREIIKTYFNQEGDQNFQFKPEFDTQKKIKSHFDSLGNSIGKQEIAIRDSLYNLHCEVLFIRDSRQPDRFHPRIAMQRSATFRDLPTETRRLLDDIYVDYYYHRHNAFWKEQAMKKLPALISTTNMLVCGEDLGMVPDSVPEVMHELEILSLEIQRMPKKPQHEFAMPADAPYQSVCTTATHDMNPLRAWWLEDKKSTQRFYNRALGIEGLAPDHCEPWIAEKIINQHLESNAMLIILPWQDWMAIDDLYAHQDPTAERINVPDNPDNFWCYRMHISLEELLKATKLNARIRNMIAVSGRVYSTFTI